MLSPCDSGIARGRIVSSFLSLSLFSRWGQEKTRAIFSDSFATMIFAALLAGPATVRMISENGPAFPLPLHLPPGHMVQQVLDENGVLTHVIMSQTGPPPPPPPPPPHHHVVRFVILINFLIIINQQKVRLS